MAAPRRATSGYFRRQRFGLYVCLVIPSLFMLGMIVYPILYNVELSLHQVDVYTLARERPFIGLENYRSLVEHRDFPVVMRNTFVFAAGSIAFQLPIGLLFALALQKPHPFHRSLRGFIAAGWMIPPIIVGTIWRWILNSDFGVLNRFLVNSGLVTAPIPWLASTTFSMPGVVMANIWFGIPFNMLLLSAGLAGIPKSLYDAAYVDGAGRFQSFRYVTLPLLLPTLFAVLILGVMFTLKLFDLVWILTGGGPVRSTTILSVWSYQLSFSFFQYGQGAALANILSVILIVVAVVYVSQIVGRERGHYENLG